METTVSSLLAINEWLKCWARGIILREFLFRLLLVGWTTTMFLRNDTWFSLGDRRLLGALHCHCELKTSQIRRYARGMVDTGKAEEVIDLFSNVLSDAYNEHVQKWKIESDQKKCWYWWDVVFYFLFFIFYILSSATRKYLTTWLCQILYSFHVWKYTVWWTVYYDYRKTALGMVILLCNNHDS